MVIIERITMGKQLISFGTFGVSRLRRRQQIVLLVGNGGGQRLEQIFVSFQLWLGKIL